MPHLAFVNISTHLKFYEWISCNKSINHTECYLFHPFEIITHYIWDYNLQWTWFFKMPLSGFEFYIFFFRFRTNQRHIHSFFSEASTDDTASRFDGVQIRFNRNSIINREKKNSKNHLESNHHAIRIKW